MILTEQGAATSERDLILRAQESGVLPAGVAPTHFVYILVGAVGMIFHQAEECKRVAGIDPAAPEVVAAHARAVEALFLGHANQDMNEEKKP